MSRRELLILGIVTVVLGFAWYFFFRQDTPPQIQSVPTPIVSSVTTESAPNSHAVALQEKATLDRSQANISGTARYKNTGEPASGVLVSVYSEKSDRQFQTETNEKGEFILSDIDTDTDLLWRAREGESWLTVSAEGTRLSPGEKRSGVEILLERPLSTSGLSGVSGTVWNTSNVNKRMIELFPKLIEAERNQNEKYAEEIQKNLDLARTPLPSIAVSLEGASLRRETVTDTTGRYAFADLPEGRYAIRATPPKGAAVERSSNKVYDKDLGPGELRVELGPGDVKNNVDFQFRFDTAAFAGHVRDTAGNPILGAEITATIVEEQAETGPINKPISVEATSASDGSYRVDGLIPLSLPGLSNPSYDVTACAEGYVSQHVRMSAYDEQIVLRLIDLFEQFDESTEDFASLLPRVNGNTYSGVDFNLPRSAIVAGELIDPQSNPIVGSTLSLSVGERQKSTRDTPATPEPANVTTDAKGDFDFIDVPPGTYDIRAEIGGAVVRTKHPPLLIQGGEEIRDLRVIAEVQTPGSIEGYITTADNRRINGDYSVRVESIDNPIETRPRTGRFLRDPADSQKFYFDDISPGIVSISVDAPGYAAAKVQTELAPGATAKVEISLAREGVLRVFVTRNGEPVEGAVSAVQMITGIERGPQFDASQQDAGYHEITGLAEGQYDVTATYSDGALYRKQRTRVSVRANEVTEIRIDLIGGSAGIRGTLFGDDKLGEGEVLVLDAVEAANDSYPFHWSCRAVYWMGKPPRAFEIDGLPSGTYLVIGRLGPRGERNLWEERELAITLRDGEIKEITFEDS